MNFLQRLRLQCIAFCTRTLRRWEREVYLATHRPPVTPNEQDAQQAQLMNSLYWPKGNTTSCSEPPRFVPNLRILKQLGSEPLSKTKRTR